MTASEGGCLCGNVRYRFEATPLAHIACHCRDCQYLSGGAESNIVAIPRSTFSITAGQEQIYRSTAESGTSVWRSFCPICGTPLFSGSAHRPELIFIRVGSLDDPSIYTRQIHIWTHSAPAWHLMEPNLPRTEKNPPNL
ncbi:MAG: GFA family protein [Rhodospirillaceae bacterium]|nr:GFA family protein [Rhodospirillaceae bacterium]